VTGALALVANSFWW